MADEHAKKEHDATHKKEGMREKLLRWGVITIIAVFVIEMFIVVMYPTQGPQQEQQQQERPREFSGVGRAKAKILSFSPDLYVVCNATSLDAPRLIGEAVNQSPAILLSTLEGGQMYYLQLADANQSNAETVTKIRSGVAGACAGEVDVLRQANVQFTEPLLLVNPENTSNTATVSTYALREGAKAFVSDENAAVEDEVLLLASVRMVGTTVVQLVAQQTAEPSEGAIEQKSGMITATVVRLEPRGVAVKQFQWEERNNVTAEAIQAALTGFEASVDYRKNNVVEVPAANESQLTELRSLPFVQEVQQTENSVLLRVAENFTDKDAAMQQISAILNVSESEVGFYTSNAIISFNFTEDANFTQATEDVRQALGSQTVFKRVGIVSPTNRTAASESLGFEVPAEFEALLGTTTNASTTTIVYVTALVQNGQALAMTAEE
ncbi:MAG: hypothetical protein AB1626_01865 [Candidatus Micrarchaeota archaeon]